MLQVAIFAKLRSHCPLTWRWNLISVEIYRCYPSSARKTRRHPRSDTPNSPAQPQNKTIADDSATQSTRWRRRSSSIRRASALTFDCLRHRTPKEGGPPTSPTKGTSSCHRPRRRHRSRLARCAGRCPTKVVSM